MNILLCSIKVQVPKNDPNLKKFLFHLNSKIGKIEISRVLVTLSSREFHEILALLTMIDSNGYMTMFD